MAAPRVILGRAQLDRLPVPWRAVPGNHDIGSATVGGWAVLALNAQLLGSGLEAEDAQWSWLEEEAVDRPDPYHG